LAALFPERVGAIAGIVLAYQPRGAFTLPPFSQARRFWYQWFMALDGGPSAVKADPRGFARIQWDTWSPPGCFDEAEFEATAKELRKSGLDGDYAPRLSQPVAPGACRSALRHPAGAARRHRDSLPADSDDSGRIGLLRRASLIGRPGNAISPPLPKNRAGRCRAFPAAGSAGGGGRGARSSSTRFLSPWPGVPRWNSYLLCRA
jgi:hypothetical protein